MKIGPKYKIARRLGAPVFEKTQTAKYTLSLARKDKGGRKFTKPKSEFGKALTEKQKARFTYGLGEKQFRGYVLKGMKASNPTQKLFQILESRLDNALFRAGLAKTRSQARQAASHGHVLVNGRRVTVPSIQLEQGQSVTLKPASAQGALFAEVTERMKTQSAPAWLEVNPEGKSFKVVGEPVYVEAEQVFDLGVVMEYYNR